VLVNQHGLPVLKLRSLMLVRRRGALSSPAAVE
jgi:hypothetical protein